MKSMEELFRQHDARYTPSKGFEDRVFARIETRKRQRRMAVTTAVVSAVLGFVFALVLSLPRSSTQPVIQARSEPRINEYSKEIVPVVEDVVFSSTKGNVQYTVEQVSLEEEAEL